MSLNKIKYLTPLHSLAFSVLAALILPAGPAGAVMIDSEAMGLTLSPADETRLILDKASFLAFQGVSTVQKLQTLNVDTETSNILKDYMASMIYIPQAMALPADEDVLDEPWGDELIHPDQYKDGADLASTEPVDAKAMEFGDSPSLQNKVLKFLKPVQNAFVSSPFGFRWGRPHQGIDMAAPVGTPIVAAESGKVVFSGWKQGYGKFIAVDHGYGYVTRYAHCSQVLVRNGQAVKKGQMIGKVGNTGRSTGPHLHFEVVAKGVHQNPAKFINNQLTVTKASK